MNARRYHLFQPINGRVGPGGHLQKRAKPVYGSVHPTQTVLHIIHFILTL